MLIVGFMIIISAMISFFCLSLIIKDTSGAVWAFITMLVGAAYLAVIAFVFMQLRVRDQKRDLVASSPQTIRRVLSDAEESYGRRWGLLYGRQDSTSELDIPGASDTEGGLLSDSDTRHILRTSILTDTELSRTRHSMPKGGHQKQQEEEQQHQEVEDDDDDDDGLLSYQNEDRVDLDENILASQLSGHAPFSLTKQSPDASCAVTIQRALTVFGFLLIAALVTLMFTFQLLATYQVVSMAVDSHLVPPTGKFFAGSSTYSFKLHLYCEGRSSSIFTPTVLIETDWASVAYEWAMVTQMLLQSSPDIRVCRYDRAGYGWSDPGLRPRDAKAEATELNKILSDAQEVGPLILVSNGYGSFIHRVFAKLTNFNVMAMVMVDALHENESTEYLKALDISPERGAELADDMADSLFAKKLLAPIAIPRLQTQTSPQLNSIDARKQLAAKGQLGYPDAVWNEFTNMFGSSQNAVSESRSSWGIETFPLTLVVSEYRINGTCEQNRIPHDKCALFLDSRDDLGDLPMALQRDLLKLSTNSELVMAKKSSSYVHLEQPSFLSRVVIETAKRSINITQSDITKSIDI
jgi:pimeloyl-ACP methyl ester carboxylesterase